VIEQIGSSVVGPGGIVLPLSAAVRAGDFVFVSGQLALRDGRIVGADTAAQTAVALDLIEGILLEAGLTLRHVVKTSVWLTPEADFKSFNAAYSERFQSPYPARATVVCNLAVPGALVEIDAVAHLGAASA
jgi:2-iminobutanoate/2-iminopropanoate deaminase